MLRNPIVQKIRYIRYRRQSYANFIKTIRRLRLSETRQRSLR
jgi:hypothetical protein